MELLPSGVFIASFSFRQQREISLLLLDNAPEALSLLKAHSKAA
jgi:hypothetical protein